MWVRIRFGLGVVGSIESWKRQGNWKEGFDFYTL